MAHPRTPLEEKLIERIQLMGRLTFRDFMEAALYDPEHGYYNSERLGIGPRGDYYTAGNVHPAFGATLARAFIETGRDGMSGAFRLVEMGAGTGRLAADILAALREEDSLAFQQLEYIIVERSPAMIARQRETLAEFVKRVRWLTMVELSARPLDGVFFSNEMVDAMPVHRVRWTGETLEEQFLTVAGGSLEFCWAEPSRPQLARYVESLDLPLRPAQVIEINLNAVEWLRDVASAICEGYLVTIDYGDTDGLLYGPDRIYGTLRCFYRHQLVDSPVERIGGQDITASVNFSGLMRAGLDVGLETVSYERQAAFLLRHGLLERIARADGVGNDVAGRLAIKNLFVPGGVSDNFRVLVQRKRPLPQ